MVITTVRWLMYRMIHAEKCVQVNTLSRPDVFINAG